jgi:hypothetical protein
MRGLLIVLLVSIYSATYGQDRTRLDSSIAKLKAEGIDTFIVFNATAENFSIAYTDDICFVNKNEVYFLYWIFKGDISVVRIDNCYKYAPIVKLKSPFVKLFTANLKKVNKELIKPFTYTLPGKEKNKKRDRLNIYNEYSFYNTIQYITQQDTVLKIYDVFDLEPIHKSLPNENYKYNSTTWTVKLANLADKETQGFTFMLKGN